MKEKNNGILTDSMIIAGFFIATLYWILDSILNIFFSNKYNIIAEIFGPDLYDIYIRVIVLCLFIIFGSHAQSALNRIKKTRDTLKQSDERYRALFEHNPIETIIVDLEGRVTGFNLAKKHSGSRLPEIGDIMYLDYAAGHQIDMYRELMECIRSGQSKIFTNRKYKDQFLQIRIEPFSQGAIITLINITEQKHFEIALKQSEKRYRTLADNIPDIIYSFDHKGRIITVNRALKSYGYEAREIIGQPFEKIIYHEDIEKVKESFNRAIENRVEFTKGYKFRMIKKSGTIRWIELNSHMSFSKKGRFIQSEGVCRDITKQKQLQDRLQQAQKMESIANLAGGVAHQFNNILSGITGNTELMMAEFPEDKTAKKYSERILYASHRMTRLTNQMLAYARKGKYQAQVISLKELIEDTIPLLKNTIDPAINLSVSLSKKYSYVKADPIQMQMVLTSVVNNAAEAIKNSGNIKIRTEHVHIKEDDIIYGFEITQGEYIALEVEDDGTGMDSESKNKIFEPFYSTKLMGRGLGMAASYGIIKNHNGWITVESKPDMGTKIRIYFPKTERPAKTDEKFYVSSLTGSGTILLVDDEEEILSTTRTALTQLGYHVIIAENGSKALDIVRESGDTIDMVILDIGLPDIRGDEVYRQITTIHPGMKVLVSTGFTVEEVASEMNIKAEAFIQKPFLFPGLSVKIKEVLGNR